MKNKISTLMCMAILIPISGCSLMNVRPSNNNPRTPKEIAQTIQSRVKYVAAFAFTMDSVKPHKEAVCQFAEQLGSFLNSYDDRDASFVKLQAAVTTLINQIENPAVRDAVAIVTDMALTEAFNYAWQYYEDYINQDQTAMALLIADAVATGLRNACSINLSIMGVEKVPPNVFTMGKH